LRRILNIHSFVISLASILAGLDEKPFELHNHNQKPFDKSSNSGVFYS